ncbi:hypothetical protein K456DRAFT_1925815 [Colletotrichum gloeosporioides 23]|nr:hypothetical protein K456DRAFT_1925815 [Colletotrichum gloeosporioides 23]
MQEMQMQVRMRFSSNGLPTCQTPEMPASLGFGSTMSTISQGQGQMGRVKGERSPHPPSHITNFSCNPVEPTSLGETLRNSPRFVVADSILWPSSRGRRLSRCGVSAAPPIVPRTCPGKTTAGRSNAVPLPPQNAPVREKEKVQAVVKRVMSCSGPESSALCTFPPSLVNSRRDLLTRNLTHHAHPSIQAQHHHRCSGNLQRRDVLASGRRRPVLISSSGTAQKEPTHGGIVKKDQPKERKKSGLRVMVLVCWPWDGPGSGTRFRSRVVVATTTLGPSGQGPGEGRAVWACLVRLLS